MGNLSGLNLGVLFLPFPPKVRITTLGSSAFFRLKKESVRKDRVSGRKENKEGGCEGQDQANTVK